MSLSEVQKAERTQLENLLHALERSSDFKGFIDTLRTAHGWGMNPQKHIVAALKCYLDEKVEVNAKSTTK